MSRLRGRSQNRESQESCPEDPGAASQPNQFDAVKTLPRLIALLLAFVTLLVYLPVAWNGFVVYDDGLYVSENHMVQNGLTWTGVKWAFTTGHASNWHPLTWLSHMLDCELFGLNAGVHHVVNVLFHALNTVLLFGLLLRLTGALWPATFIAALFAWHPLHVESVAWISERKDVLSTCFALLSLLAYVEAVTGDRWQVTRTAATAPVTALSRVTCHLSPSYWLALTFFALGLMAKPMLVTLPFVMLLLDYWPIQRFNHSTIPRLVLEKWPFFLLVAASCVVTFLAQHHGEAVMTLQQFPLNLRLENALISYERYLLNMVWPVGLAVLYPLPDHLSWIRAMAALAVVVLSVISWFTWRARRQYPCLLVGWLWFLGTLVPVIGVVQVGSAALADRYTYFPLVGIFIAVAFGVRDLTNRWPIPKSAVAVAAGAILAACLVLTENQLRYWRDSESLFAHALAVTTDNPNARIDYGVALEQQGRFPEALAEYREALRLSPDNVQAQYNIGNVLDKMGRPEEARPELVKAVQLDPKLPSSRDALGAVLVELGHFEEATDQFTEALRLDPNHSGAHFDLGKALLKQGRDAAAIDEFRVALRLDPDNFQILAYTAHVLAAAENAQIRDGKAALVLAAKANQLVGGTQPFVLDVLAMAYAETGRFDEAQQAAQDAFDLATAAKMTRLEPLQQRLQFYRNHQPWRESFLATNTVPAEIQKH